MRVVAGSAFVVLDGLMLHFAGSELLLKIIMAFEAKLPIRFNQEFLVVRNMRAVAGSAFVVLDGLMFHLSGGELLLNVVVALKAEFPIRLQQEVLLV